MNYIVKRDGRKVKFNPDKIKNALMKAMVAVRNNDEVENYMEVMQLTQKIVSKCYDRYKQTEPTVEQVQDIVVETLIESGIVDVSKAYIEYRQRRSEHRDSQTALMKKIEDITFSDSKDSNLKRDNANVDGNTAMGTMLQYGSAVSKQFATDKLLGKEFVKEFKKGNIYPHDLDFMPMGTTTCTQINLEKLFKNGFNTGHGTLRKPKSIASYASLTAIAIQANQNDQHGGQSIPLLDFYLAPGVTYSYIKNIKNNLNIIFDANDIEANTDSIVENIVENHSNVNKIANKKELIDKLTHEITNQYTLDTNKIMGYVEKSVEKAIQQTEKQTYQAMEGLVHNLNTMHSRAGAQVPFSSLNFGMDTSEEGRMVSRNLMLAQEAGLGNGETPIFPILIFQVKEGVNYNPEDPNYDLYKLAMRVSAKRLFPNFVFVDAPFNLQYYKPEDPETIISTMGCVDGNEVVTYKWDGYLFVESFDRFWEKVSLEYPVDYEGDSEYFDLEGLDADITIYDSMSKKFVKCKKLIRNPDQKNWVKLVFSNGRELIATDDHPLPLVNKGRTFVKDIKVGDELYCVNDQYSEECAEVSPQDAWLLGVILRNAAYRKTTRILLNKESSDIVEQIKDILETKTSKDIEIKKLEKREEIGYEVNVCDPELSEQFFNLFEGCDKLERIIPSVIYLLSRESKMSFIAGIIDSHAEILNREDSTRVRFSTANKELALQEMLLVQSVGIHAQITHRKFTKNKKAYHVEFPINEELYGYLVSENKKNKIEFISDDKNPSVITVEEIQFMGYRNQMSFDVETESDYFDVSGILSHNCRTRVFGNINGKETPVGRGNLSFTTINLPRLGIEYGIQWRKNNKVDSGYDKEGFMTELDNMIELAVQQLKDRLDIQKRKKVKNFPFLMGQGLWTGSDSLNSNDEIGDVLEGGTLSVGFIGLAECLKGLIDKHHGEDDEAQELGLEIIEHMRKRMDEATIKYHLNYSLLATPAEGLSGYFTRIDKKRYGKIKGVTDKDYYTNSFHVPVYYHINAFNKIKKEAPYHALTNAGHITYIEMDGDPSNNIEAFEAVVRCMKESGIGYGSINHPVDRDPICGYSGIIYGNVCPKCGRRDNEHRMFEDKFKRIKL